MQKIVIIGTGAVAAELTSYIEDNNNAVAEDEKLDLIGYIDYDYNKSKYYDVYGLEKPLIADIDTYQFPEEVQVIMGISDIEFRNKLIAILKSKSVELRTFIHTSSIIAKSAEIGSGCIIYPFCIIGPNVKLGDYNLITSYSAISHDCVIGNGNFFSTAILAGRVVVGNDNFFGVRSTVIPSLSIGNNATIQAGMIVDKNVENDTTVFYRFKEKVMVIKQNN